VPCSSRSREPNPTGPRPRSSVGMWVSAAANLYCSVHGVCAGGCVNMTHNPPHCGRTTGCAIHKNRKFQIPCRPDQLFDVCLMGLGLTDCSVLIQGARVGLNSRLAGLCVEVRHACATAAHDSCRRVMYSTLHMYVYNHISQGKSLKSAFRVS
jgi:hypothetical protein